MSASAFITGLFVVTAPAFEALAYRRAPCRTTLLALPLAVLGVLGAVVIPAAIAVAERGARRGPVPAAFLDRPVGSS